MVDVALGKENNDAFMMLFSSEKQLFGMEDDPFVGDNSVFESIYSPVSDLNSPTSSEANSETSSPNNEFSADSCPMEIMDEFTFNEMGKNLCTMNPAQMHISDFNTTSIPCEIANPITEVLASEKNEQMPLKRKGTKRKQSPKKSSRPRKRAKAQKNFAPTAVTLPRDKLLKMSSKELDEHVAELKKSRELTPAEEKDFKRQRRLIKNRESAQLSRVRRKRRLQELEETVNMLQQENLDLKGRLSSSTSENNKLKEEVTRLNRLLESTKATPTTKSSMNKLWKAVSIQKTAPSAIRTAGVYLLVVLLSFGLFFHGGAGPNGGNLFATSTMPQISRGVVISGAQNSPAILPGAPGARDILELTDHNPKGKGIDSLAGFGEDTVLQEDKFCGLKRKRSSFMMDSIDDSTVATVGTKDFPIVIDLSSEDPAIPLPARISNFTDSPSSFRYATENSTLA